MRSSSSSHVRLTPTIGAMQFKLFFVFVRLHKERLLKIGWSMTNMGDFDFSLWIIIIIISDLTLVGLFRALNVVMLLRSYCGCLHTVRWTHIFSTFLAESDLDGQRAREPTIDKYCICVANNQFNFNMLYLQIILEILVNTKTPTKHR